MTPRQHPSNNRVLGAPPGVSAEECSALPITDVQMFDGSHGVASYWYPSAEELAGLNAGKGVCVAIQGRTHAPMYIGVET